MESKGKLVGVLSAVGNLTGTLTAEGTLIGTLVTVSQLDEMYDFATEPDIIGLFSDLGGKDD